MLKWWQRLWNKYALRTTWLPVFKRGFDEQDGYETSMYSGVYGYRRDSPWYGYDDDWEWR